jgi:hypothetical protein
VRDCARSRRGFARRPAGLALGSHGDDYFRCALVDSDFFFTTGWCFFITPIRLLVVIAAERHGIKAGPGGGLERLSPASSSRVEHHLHDAEVPVV